jgi:hypothetical protein
MPRPQAVTSPSAPSVCDKPPTQLVRKAPEVANFADLIDWRRSHERPGGVVALVFDWARLSSVQQEILADSVRGLGGLGAATDAEQPELALFENRAFGREAKAPADETISDGAESKMGAATRAISSYFVAMIELFEQQR